MGASGHSAEHHLSFLPETTADSLIVARKGGAVAIFNMYDGTITCDDFQIAPQDTDTSGTVNLYGGIVDANEIEIATEGGTGLLDIQGGTLLINADTMGPDQVYRARQDISSYVVPETLSFGQAYYWRVDEGDAGTSRLDRGEVWQFTAKPFPRWTLAVRWRSTSRSQPTPTGVTA